MRALLLTGGAVVAVAPGAAHAERAPEALYTALAKQVADAPSRGDLDAIVAQVGKDPKALAAWVGANVRFEPYDGILRGAAGTAAARGGNAIDQALLVQALFERAGHEATIMTRTLSAAERKARLAAFLGEGGAAVLADVPRLGKDAAGSLLDAEAMAAAEALQRADAAAVEEAVAAAAKVAPVLVGALGKALRPRKIDAPRAHFWVEVGGAPYDTVAPDLAHEGGKAVDAKQLDALRHTVVLALVMKRTRDGKVEEEVLLQVPVALDAAAWAPIELTIRPEPTRLGITPEDGRKDVKTLIKKLAAAPVLRASLLVGSARHGAAGFDRQGVRYEIADDGEVGGPAQLGAALGGAFGGFGGGFGGGAPKGEAKLAFDAVVFRVEVRGPGEGQNPERVHERVLVTAAPEELPVVRLSLLAENLVLAAGERELSTARALLKTKPALDALVRGDKDAAERMAAPSEPASTLVRYADLRRRVQEKLGAGGRGQHFRERTGIVALIDRLVPDGAGQLAIARRFDIFANPVAFVTPTGQLDASLALAQGVADTALEAALLGPSSERARRGTAWAVLAAAAAHGAPKTEEVGGVVKVSWSEGAWWSVDPKSGGVVGRVPGGGGQAMVEYAYEVASKVCNWAFVLSIFAAANPDNHYHGGDIDKWAGRMCSVVTGTEIQQYQSEQIGEITSGLWKIAIPAMMGLPAKK